MAKLWAGRTDGKTEQIADDFNSSIHFDCRMFRQDITGSMAHAAMLAAKGIIGQEDADTLIAGLESICLDKMTLHEKQKLAITYAELVYNGQWFTPLREALAAFVDKTQEKVTGKVRLKLYKGNIIPAGTTSPYSLYSENLVTFDESDYDQKQAEGFINLWGLPTTVQALREQGKL